MGFLHSNVPLHAPFDSEASNEAWYGVSIPFGDEKATLRVMYHAHAVSSCDVFFHPECSKTSSCEGIWMCFLIDMVPVRMMCIPMGVVEAWHIVRTPLGGGNTP